MAAPLLRYDLLLARRSFADAFATARDRLLVVLVVGFAALWLREAGAPAAASLSPRAVLLAVLAGPAAYGWNAALLRRLAWFRETSVLAPDALVPGAGRLYLAWAQLPLIASILVLVTILGASTGEPLRCAVVAFLAYAAGLAVARASRGRPTERTVRSPGHEGGVRDNQASGGFEALLARKTFGAQRPLCAAAFLVAGATAATLVGAWLAATQPPATQFAAALFPSALLLLATGRNAPEIVGLLAYAGYPARYVAASVCALPAANLLGASIALLLVRPEGWAGLIATLFLLHLLAALVATARAWLSPGRPARRVDLQVQLELAALLVVGGLFAPLVPAVVAWRLWLLRRHYSRLRWIQT